MTTMSSRNPMTTTTQIKWTLSCLTLLSLVACSGSNNNTNNPPPVKTIADRLDYTNPTSGTYTLVKDTALSTSTHLVLNLMGPVGTQGTGVGFYLTADTTKVTWAKVSGGDAEYVKNGAFTLGSGTQLLKSKITTNQLQGGVFQKGTTAPAVTFTATGPLASVALDLKSNVSLGAVTFSSIAGQAVLTNGSAAPAPIVISYGSLAAN
ncbi:MAG: hypothetical protein IPP78_03960 [Holophagaceae bacterium]|nr:hypothetical protein [Holophagaceae bacterium]